MIYAIVSASSDFFLNSREQRLKKADKDDCTVLQLSSDWPLCIFKYILLDIYWY